MNDELVKAFETIEASLKDENSELVNEVTTKLSQYVPKEELGLDVVKEYMSKNDAGKEFLNNIVEQEKKNAINDFTKSKDYKKSIEKQIKEATEKREAELRKELDKSLTPEQKKIAELEAKQAETERMLQMKEIKLEASNLIQEKKLHKDLVEFVIDPSSLENTSKNIEKVSALIEQLVKQGVEREFQNIGRDPRKGSGTNQVISKKMLEDLAAKAKASGRLEDRVKYAQLKQQYAEQAQK